MGVGDRSEIEIGGGDVAEQEALEPELVVGAVLGEVARLLERREEPERGRARNPGAAAELRERQPAVLIGERFEQRERLCGRVDAIPARLLVDLLWICRSRRF